MMKEKGLMRKRNTTMPKLSHLIPIWKNKKYVVCDSWDIPKLESSPIKME